MDHRQRARRHNETPIRSARKSRDRSLDLGCVLHVDFTHFHPNRWCHRLNDGELANPSREGGIPKDGHPRDVWGDFLEQSRPFPAQRVFELNKAGRVAAGPRHGVNVTSADRISDIIENDWNGACRPQQRWHARIASYEDYVGVARDQTFRMCAYFSGVTSGPADVDLQIATLDPAQLL